MSHSCFIHSCSYGNLGCFHILAIVNNTTTNIGLLMFFWISVLGSSRYIPRSEIAGSKGRPILNFLRYLHTAFHSGCINLHSHQQSRRVPLSLHILASICYLLIYWWSPFWQVWDVLLICISLMISDVEHPFICLLAICTSLWWSVSSGSLPIF